MERIVHQLVQGSPEWDAFRLEHDGASEAPVMLGLSKKTKRTELLRAKSTGLPREFSKWMQENVLDRGHEIEALARPFAVEFAGVDGFYPATVSVGRLSASTDGLDMLDETAWECKTLNQDNGPIVQAGRVPEEHMPQCQQVLMVTGADRLLFTVSDGTRENTFHTWVEPDTDWFDRIRAGWRQFHEDLANYVHVEEAPAPIGRSPETLPALLIQVRGEVTDSNLDAFKDHALAVFGSINRNLVTDEDFANAAKAVKWCGDVESRLAAAKQHALSQTESIDRLFRTLDEISAEARKVRLELDKLNKARRDERRLEIMQDAEAAFKAHMVALQKRIGPSMPAIKTDFPGAIRGLSSFASMIDKCGVELARAKIEANAVADRIQINLDYLRDNAQEFSFLFADKAALVQKAHDDLRALVENRIMAHQKTEADRLERERAAIAEQERIKAEAKVRAEQAEAAKAEREEAERQRRADQESRDAIAKAAVPVTQLAPEPAPAITKPQPFPVMEPAVPPSMSLGQISTRLGFQVTGAFLRRLGFEPGAQVKAASLYHESEFPAICRALIEHIESVMETAPA